MPRGRIRGAASFLFGAWRSRPTGRRVLYVLALILGLSGTGMLSYPVFTDIFSSREQERLAEEFRSPEFHADYQSGEIEPGRVLTRILIPSIGLDALVVEGTGASALRAGAGHYRSTPLPCEAGNVGIAGHRTTYGKPFNRIDEIRFGDEIILVTPERRCTYRVADGPGGAARPARGAPSWITHPKDGAVIGPLEGSWLTLTTCHPKGSAAKRLILRAELIEA